MGVKLTGLVESELSGSAWTEQPPPGCTWGSSGDGPQRENQMNQLTKRKWGHGGLQGGSMGQAGPGEGVDAGVAYLAWSVMQQHIGTPGLHYQPWCCTLQALAACLLHPENAHCAVCQYNVKAYEVVGC